MSRHYTTHTVKSRLGMGRHASLSTQDIHAGTLYFVALLREELGRRIKVARLAAKLTQQELAEKIGLKHAQDVSRYERGITEVPGHRIDLISEATGRPRSYFVRDPSEEHISEDRITVLEEQVGVLLRQNDMLLDLVRELRGEGGEGSAPPQSGQG